MAGTGERHQRNTQQGREHDQKQPPLLSAFRPPRVPVRLDRQIAEFIERFEWHGDSPHHTPTQPTANGEYHALTHSSWSGDRSPAVLAPYGWAVRSDRPASAPQIALGPIGGARALLLHRVLPVSDPHHVVHRGKVLPDNDAELRALRLVAGPEHGSDDFGATLRLAGEPGEVVEAAIPPLPAQASVPHTEPQVAP